MLDAGELLWEEVPEERRRHKPQFVTCTSGAVRKTLLHVPTRGQKLHRTPLSYSLKLKMSNIDGTRESQSRSGACLQHMFSSFRTNPNMGIQEWSGRSEWASGQRGCGWGSLADCLQTTESDLKRRGCGWCGAGWTVW